MFDTYAWALNKKEAQEFDRRVARRQKERIQVENEQDELVRVLYRNTRTYSVVDAEPVFPDDRSEKAAATLPKTVTLVTPDPADPSRDQLYIGPYPVRRKDFSYQPERRLAEFRTHDGTTGISGSFEFSRLRLEAFGTIEYGDVPFTVRLVVKPQTYHVRVCEGAAFFSGDGGDYISWNVDSDEWKNGEWSKDAVLHFTYGVKQAPAQRGDDPELVFTAKFRDYKSGEVWEPPTDEITGGVRKAEDGTDEITFSHLYGRPPQSMNNLFPYRLRAVMAPFSDTFEGGMAVDIDGDKVVYGIQGEWSGGRIGGMYYLKALTKQTDAPHAVIAVHDDTMYINDVPVKSRVQGRKLVWWGYQTNKDVPLPESGSLTFSPDGEQIVATEGLKAEGRRVDPETAAQASPGVAGTGIFIAKRTVSYRTLSVTALLNMTPHDVEDGKVHDAVQKAAMEDSHQILVSRMDPDLRAKFIAANPPLLDPAVEAIARQPVDGINPTTWYAGLSESYVAGALRAHSDDPGARKLNGRRANEWFRKQCETGKVMSAHTRALYVRHLEKRYTTFRDYLDDQKNKAEEYKPQIDETVAKWVSRARNSFSASNDEDKEKLEEVIARYQNLGTYAKDQKRYWAFALFATATSVSQLNKYLGNILNGDSGLAVAKEVEKVAALLGALDPSGKIAGEYMYVLGAFNITSLLPQLSDYATSHDYLAAAVRETIQKFIEKYQNSDDEEMRKLAKELAEKATAENIRDLLGVLSSVSRLSGEWAGLIVRYEEAVGKQFPKLVGIARVISYAAAAAMIYFFAAGVVDWDEVPDQQKAVIIATTVSMVAQMASIVIRNGLAAYEVFKSGYGFMSIGRALLGQSYIGKISLDGLGGFRSWLLQSGMPRNTYNLKMGQQAIQAGVSSATIPGAGSGVSKVSAIHKIFGRNLTEFMSTRFTAALALVGMGISIWSLVEGSGDPYETTANALFLAASTLQFVASAGAWAVSAGLLGSLGGFAISTMLTLISVLGVVALIAGVVFLILWWTRPRETEVEKFAARSNFYSPQEVDIDDFEIYEPSGGGSARVALSMAAHGDDKRCMRIEENRTLSQKPFDKTARTAFYLHVDEEGRAMLRSPVVQDGTIRAVDLVLDDNGKLVVQDAATTDRETDEKKKKRARWRAELQGGIEREQIPSPDGGGKQTDVLKAARFRLYNEYWYLQTGKKRYLDTDGTTGWKATDGSGATVRLRMEVLGFEGLRMNDIHWTTNRRNLEQYPSFEVPGSQPIAFSLSPALPADSNLEFDSGTGRIRMKPSTKVKPVPKGTYTLTAKGPQNQDSVEFTFEVSDPAKLMPPEAVTPEPRRAEESLVGVS